MSLRSHQFRRPSVYVTEADYDRLSSLAASSETRGASILGDELARAIVLKEDDFPRNIVRLHTYVEFTDLMTGRTRRVQIVPPDEADIDCNRLSVLTPVGASLLGLTAGDSIGMTTDDGRSHVLRVASLEYVHEAA